jgi:hypothetical protein
MPAATMIPPWPSSSQRSAARESARTVTSKNAGQYSSSLPRAERERSRARLAVAEARMTLRFGYMPRYQAGKVSEISIDFPWRGGIVTMSRWSSPETTHKRYWLSRRR